VSGRQRLHIALHARAEVVVTVFSLLLSKRGEGGNLFSVETNTNEGEIPSVLYKGGDSIGASVSCLCKKEEVRRGINATQGNTLLLASSQYMDKTKKDGRAYACPSIVVDHVIVVSLVLAQAVMC